VNGMSTLAERNLDLGDAFVVQERVARQTRTTVQVVDNRGGLFDADDENGWFTVCVDHGGVCSHETLALARAFAPVPREWCPTCQEAARLEQVYGPNPQDVGAEDGTEDDFGDLLSEAAEFLHENVEDVEDAALDSEATRMEAWLTDLMRREQP
jgi:hypothetical protein